MSEPEKRPFDTLEFPCPFMFRIIARQNETIVDQCTTLISGMAEVQSITPLPKNKMMRIRIEIRAESADQIYKIYDLLGKVEDILMVI
jgi:putative lipoic acid-binding regulatory protein